MWRKIPERVNTRKPPFDGAHVLLGEQCFVCEGYYDTESPSGGGWFKANTHWTDVPNFPVFPTHWRPLPAPPPERA